MSLKKYNEKRKFDKTPEPKGKRGRKKIKPNTNPPTFVVQKHEASRLHYDFRLELDGVLKSWAIPKGPSLNPKDKRLAMMVEDHPLDYASFEGIIPKGNYGGGTVMVWDEGVYSPLETIVREDAEKVLQAQIHKGNLKFLLAGKKLQGEFALVKTVSRGENSWLLMKKNDEYAKEEDITKSDRSVKTGRTLTEIAENVRSADDIWISNRNIKKKLDIGDAPKTPMPHNITPMLTTLIDKPFDNKDFLFEIKWDGFRAIAEVENHKVHLYSRNNLPFTSRFPEIAASLAKLPFDVVLDGEITVLNKEGKPEFQLLQNYQSSLGELVYYIFDLLYIDGYDLQHLPLLKRKEILKKILLPLPHVAFSDHVEKDGTAFFKTAARENLEGIIAKNTNSFYQQGKRTNDWLKVKTYYRQEAVIGGFTKPRGSRKEFGALVLGVYDENNNFIYIGHAGGGFNEEGLTYMKKKLEKLVQEESPFMVTPKTNTQATWVKPKLVAEISFAGWTNGGHMRHPVFIGLREDKKAEKVRREIPKVTSAKKPETKIASPDLKLTHLSKVFWPKEGYTKGDLLDYYDKMSSFILPYLIDRPESLLRFPNGINGKSFFQKDVAGIVPDWIKTIPIHSDSEDRTIEYLLCQNKATLLYMVNLGCVDMNPWNSRSQHLDNPDYLVIDLDPHNAPFSKVVETALKTREVLEMARIRAFCKTSGATGLHIYVPLAAAYTYDQVRQFAQLLAIVIHQKLPDITSVVRNPTKRQGKVYIDFLQNRRGQTMAAPYSVRAREGATVSAPLLWEEVTNDLSPQQFTIKSMPERLEKVGDIFKPVLGGGIDMEKALTRLNATSYHFSQ